MIHSIKEIKALLHDEVSYKNTVLGTHLNSLFPLSWAENSGIDKPAYIHSFEEKVEVMVQMGKNGIDVFSQNYKLGSVTKAFHEIQLEKVKDFK